MSSSYFAHLPLFVRGLIVGFAIAAPVGPIGILCIRRTLAGGRAAGLASGLGAATADALYGSIAAFGLTFVSKALMSQQTWLRLIGGLFLCYLGIKLFRARPSQEAASIRGEGLGGAFVSTFFLTLTNPMTLLSFAAIFAGLGIANAHGEYLAATLLVLGVFMGSSFWWVFLSSAVGAVRKKFNPRGLRWINGISGMILLAFGVLALLGLIG